MEKILVLEAKYIHALGAVRNLPALMAARDGDLIWLRGIPAINEDGNLLASLPVRQSYLVDLDELLFPVGGKTPVGKLKKLSWQAIRTFITVEPPVSAMPGVVTVKMPVRLNRSEHPREAYALMTTLSDWKIFADAAPGVRLRPLKFAVSDTGQVLIIGSPLPVIKGQLYWQNKQMLLPAGFDFDPPAIAGIVCDKITGEDGGLMVFDHEGNWEDVPSSGFRQAKRSAIRLTQI